MTEYILGIDTSTRVCVGFARDGKPRVSQAVGDSRSHVELLIPTVKTVLNMAAITPSQLTGIAIGMGPGPYTGLRVGVATAEMLAQAWDLRLYHVCSLDAIAIGWALTHPLADFIACSDARRKELYWAVYNRFGQRLDGPNVSLPTELPQLPCVGPGALIYPKAGAGMDPYLTVRLGVWIDQFAPRWPDLADVQTAIGLDAAVLAGFAPLLPDAGVEPLYLRHADTAPSRPAKSVLVESQSQS